ncbi:MAG: hypothetical protein PWQ96_1282 [Clostridia bacterium]|nr:hypothetical protein [Clostridia bacterium]
MRKTYKSMCPLDCFDNCSLELEVENGIITKVFGDKEHNYTKGFICSKGRKLLERVYSSDRILYPMEKHNGGWRKISWDDAYARITAELKEILAEYGSQAILHLHASGSNGVLKLLSRRFFNCLGGATVTSGGLCWDAGDLAQKLDFGEATSHLPWDLVNSKTILLWGRDPAVTNLHLIPYLKEAASRGAKVIIINPLQVKSRKFACEHIAPKPGTDGALAIGMAHHILKERLVDFDFITENVLGFEEYAHMVAEMTPERAAEITGISSQTIRTLAETYATSKPAAIVLGYGLQRYANGVNTVRAIDSLAAITGNIGISGGGVSYNYSAGKRKLLADITGEEYAVNTREIPYPAVGKKVQELTDPPIKAIFCTCSNPVTQLPNTVEVKMAFHEADFVVTLDYTLTDTAEMSDLVLPVTTIFEEEQLVANGMSPFVGYVKPVIPPRGQCKPDSVVFTELAEQMGLENFGNKSPREWIEKALNNEKEYKADDFIGTKVNPYLKEVPWEEKDFKTPSGKVELFSEEAEKMGLTALPEYHSQKDLDEYPLTFMTPHPEKALHSQFRHEDSDIYNLPRVYVHPKTAKKYNLRNVNEVVITSPQGEIRALVQVSDYTREDTVVIEEGWWFKEGGNAVNILTSDKYEEAAKQALYYDCKCNLRKVY